MHVIRVRHAHDNSERFQMCERFFYFYFFYYIYLYIYKENVSAKMQVLCWGPGTSQLLRYDDKNGYPAKNEKNIPDCLLGIRYCNAEKNGHKN